MRATARSLSLVATVTATAGTIHGQPFFEEVTAAVGIEFVHRHFATGRKYMPENMGAGVAILDVDGDGRLDIYLVQGTGSLPGADPDPTATNRLYRQTETGVFEDVTAAAGAGDPGYGMGVAFGDVDGDGDLDLFVSNYGPDAFYRNRGDGSFEEATAEAGLGDPGWAASAGFFDADGDGDLDLWVTRYLDWSPAGNKFCGNAQANLRSYCHPDVYDGARDLLYRNDGAGAFTEIGRAAGLADSRNDKGLGVTFADLDGDGHMDVYVANDSTRNYLYLGDGTGRFREEGLLAGVGLNARGDREASMGVEVGDLNADGRPDLFVTHLDEETNTYYASSGPGLWLDRTAAAGLAEPSRPWVGFGTVVADFDLDGDEDLFVANGHIIDNIDRFDAARRHRQPAQLFLGDGTGTFTVAAGALGLDRDLVGRGAAGGDLDGDGDVDLVITQNGGAAVVLRNASPRRGRLVVTPAATASTPSVFGARVEVVQGGRSQVRWIKSASSYLSQGAPEAYFAVAADGPVELVVTWPGGRIDRHAVAVDTRQVVGANGRITARPLLPPR